jgi:predicted transposase/invertase (TIGR01784 family)
MFSGFGSNGAYEMITQIVERLRELTDSEQSLEKYIFQLVNLARLRHLTKVTQQVLKDMPINFDIEKDAFYQEGIEKGEQNKALELALRMKGAGFATADIAKATGLTEEQIKKL